MHLLEGHSTHEFSRLVLVGWITLGYLTQIARFLISLQLTQECHFHFGEPLRKMVVGGVDKNPDGHELFDQSMAPWLGNTSDILASVEQKNFHSFYVALPPSRSDMIETLYRKFLDKNIDILCAPYIFALKLLNHGARKVAGAPLQTFNDAFGRVEEYNYQAAADGIVATCRYAEASTFR